MGGVARRGGDGKTKKSKRLFARIVYVCVIRFGGLYAHIMRRDFYPRQFVSRVSHKIIRRDCICKFSALEEVIKAGWSCSTEKYNTYEFRVYTGCPVNYDGVDILNDIPIFIFII